MKVCRLIGFVVAQIVIMSTLVAQTSADEISHKEHERYTGVKYSYFEDGSLRSETTYVEGKKHGYYKEWYDNGRVKLVKNFNYGVADGAFVLYRKNGKTLEQKGYFLNNQPFGSWSFYDRKGNLYKILVYNESGILTASDNL